LIARIFLLFFLIALFYSPTGIQAEKIEWHFEQMTSEQGLSQNSVSCIIQDSTGFLWAGTESGLNRFDGHNFVVFQPEPGNPNSISDNIINTLTLDKTGTLWIGTSNGLNKYEDSTASFTRFLIEPDTNPFSIYEILHRDSSTIWLGSNRGLIYFNPLTGNYRIYSLLKSTEPPEVKAITFADGKKLWVGTSAGLFIFDPKNAQVKHYRHKPGDSSSLSSNYINKLFKDKNGTLWIGTKSGGLNRFSPTTGVFKKYICKTGKEKEQTITALFGFNEQELWVGVSDKGLTAFNLKTETYNPYPVILDESSIYQNNLLTAIYKDASGVYWLGTFGNGLIKLVKYYRGFEHYKVDEELKLKKNANMVFAFAEAGRQKYWIGTWNGLYQLDKNSNSFRHFEVSPKVREHPYKIFSLYSDSNNRLWICSRNSGLHYLDENQAECRPFILQSQTKTFLKDTSIYSITADSSGILWLGSNTGLYALDPATGKVEIFRHEKNNPASLSYNFIRTLFFDNKGDLWIGTMGGGLDHFNLKSKTFKHYKFSPTNPNSISSNQVMAINQDNKGRIWVGTNGGGLLYLNRATNKFKQVNLRLKKSNFVIYSIIRDKNDHLWVTGLNGIFRIKIKANIKAHFVHSDGLQHNEFNAGAGFASSSGHILIGGFNGFNIFHPDSLKRNEHVPKVVLTDIKIFSESYCNLMSKKEGQALLENCLPVSASLDLQYNQNFITFEFAGLDFTNPDKNSFVYRLKYFERKWHKLRGGMSAIYTAIPPGSYEFEVRAANNDGKWTRRGIAQKIIIHPPYWATYWFYAILLFIFGLILVTIHKLRLRNIKRQNLQLAEINIRLTNEAEERLSVQRALKESQRKLTTLIQNLPGIAYRCKNDYERTMEFISEGCLALTGFPAGEITENSRLSFSQLIHPEDRLSVINSIKNHIKDKLPFHLGYRIIHKKNRSKWVWEQGQGIYDEAGNLEAIEGLITDITDRKQLEERLYQSQKIEAIGLLAGGIAHDFNNFLTIIRGYSELSMALLEDKHPVMSKLSHMSSAVDKAEALTRQLLAFSSKQVLHPTVFDLNLLIQEEQKMLSRLIGEHIDLKTELQEEPAMIKADRSQVDQIIMNLIINARDAMPEGGELVISTNSKWEEKATDGFGSKFLPGRYIHMRICDTGFGMDEHTIQHIFEPFFTTKHQGKGTGLGLATVYGIVKQSGGHITVTSRKDTGTTFHLYFPEATILSSRPEKQDGFQKSKKGIETILLVEDKEEVRSVIKENLTSLGYAVVEAANGEHALEICSKSELGIDLLLTDVIMPKMNGKILADNLLLKYPKIKILFMSGYTDDTLGENGAISKSTNFIQKPFSVTGLSEKIREIIEE